MKPEARSQKPENGRRKVNTPLAGGRFSTLWLLTAVVCILCSVFVAGCGKTVVTGKSILPADLANRFNAERAWHDMERVVGFGLDV